MTVSTTLVAFTVQDAVDSSNSTSVSLSIIRPGCFVTAVAFLPSKFMVACKNYLHAVVAEWEKSNQPLVQHQSVSQSLSDSLYLYLYR